MGGLWDASMWRRQFIYGKEMRAAHKRDNSGSGIIILEENFVQIGLIIVENK